MNDKLSYISAGLDVSSEKLDVYLMNQQENGKHIVFSNNEAGVSEMITWFKSNDFHGKVVMESTGRYHEYVATTLYTKGYATYVINPLRAKKYQLSGIQKIKSDKQDSKILAEMGIKEKMLDIFDLDHKKIGIKKKISLVRSMEKQLQKLRAIISNYQESQEKLGIKLSEIEISFEEKLKELDRLRDKLEKEVISEVFPKGDKEAQKSKEILNSISGISEYYAAMIYFYYSLNKGRNINSWVSYTGLAITVEQSGKWKGVCKLSKRGNKYLRKRNFTAGWGGYMHDEGLKEYYKYLKTERGRSHTASLVIIGRKILRIAYSCLKFGKKYDPQITTLNIPKNSPSSP